MFYIAWSDLKVSEIIEGISDWGFAEIPRIFPGCQTKFRKIQHICPNPNPEPRVFLELFTSGPRILKRYYLFRE